LTTVVFLYQIINYLSRQFFVGYCLLHQTAHWLIKSRMHKIINRSLSQINKQKTAMEKELIACCEVLELFYEE
jgi:peroxiredoxin family protein